MVHRQIRRTFIEIRTVDERVRLRDKASIRTHERTVRICPAGARLSHNRRDADKTIRRQRIDSELIVSLIRESIVTTQRKPSRKAARERDYKTVVRAFIPRTKRADRSGGKRRQKLTARSARCKRDIRFAQTQQVIHLPMIVISLDDDVLD